MIPGIQRDQLGLVRVKYLILNWFLITWMLSSPLILTSNEKV